MTELQAAMCIMIKTFESYSSTQGNPHTLTTAEARSLLEKEFSEMIKLHSKSDVDEFLNKLDTNKDSEINFQEFMVLVTTLTCICHEIFSKK